MRKNHLTLIFLITFAVVLSILVLGTLAPQSFTQNNGSATNAANPLPKVLISIVPSSLMPSATSPFPAPSSINTSNLSLSSSTDNFTIPNVHVNASEGSFLVSVFNNGSSEIAITNVYVNDYSIKPEKDIPIPTDSTIKLLLTLTDGITFANTYQIRLLSSEGYSATFYEIID